MLETVSERRRGKERARVESESDSEPILYEFHDSDTDEADDERPSGGKQRRKTTKSPLAERVQRQRGSLTKGETIKLNREVRALVKAVWDLSKDVDIEFQEVASSADIKAYEDGTGDGPDAKLPLLYMRGSMSCEWNREVCRVLLDKFKRGEYMKNVTFASEELVFDTIVRKCTTLRDAWRRAQPRLDIDGRVESIDEAADRLQEGTRIVKKRARQAGRRSTVSDLVLPWRMLYC